MPELFDSVDDASLTPDHDPAPANTNPLSRHTSLLGGCLLAATAFLLFPLGQLLAGVVPLVAVPQTGTGLWVSVVGVFLVGFVLLDLLRLGLDYAEVEP